MAYQGFITKVKELRKHSNADRLQVATVFGNDVIVSLDVKVGDMMVYFPTDGRLGAEYCKENNLVRRKDENGNNVGGYLDPDKRHVGTLKLRGERSDGLLMPIESLSKFTNINKLKEGDPIDFLNGVEICKKYIPRGRRRKQGQGAVKQKKAKDIKYPLFMEHKDTKQLAYFVDNFREGDFCDITLKMHGCFQNETPVKLWGKSKALKINKLKKGDIVVGYRDGQLVPSKVLNTFINGKTQDWQHIKISRIGKAGENIQNIHCTPDHLFWDEANQQWKHAKDLKSRDMISTVKMSKISKKTHKEILLGKILGDGYYANFDGGAEIQFSHKKLHEQYVDYTIKILNGLAYKVKGKFMSGYGTEMVRAKTYRTSELKSYFDKLLCHDGINKLTDEVINQFTPLSLAMLYMDDGSLSHTDVQKDRASLAICDYNHHDSEIIVKCLKKLGINGVLYQDTNGYNRIRLNTEDAYTMFKMIKKYIPPVMKYKLPLEYREEPFVPLCTGEVVDGYCYDSQVILSNEPYSSKRMKGKYDIETETHNYVVGDCIVHNSSGRTSHTIQEKTNKWKKVFPTFTKWFNIKWKPVKTWEYITGTRRVVLRNISNNDDGGFYGTNMFRKKWHDEFEGKLKKGETVYYEIVGYVDGETPIMSTCANKKTKDKEFIKRYGDTTTFTYGCEEGQNDIYVYRMTMTNEDGDVFEYPYDLVQRRCEEMNVKSCPLFDRFIFTTKEDLMERVNKYHEGADPIDTTHIREGVVVRIENRNTFVAYKHKNFEFKVLESIIKLDDVVDMEEAQEVQEVE